MRKAQSGKRTPSAEVQILKRLCPYCGDYHTCRWGRFRGSQRYRCRQCGRTFNALTGTTYARLRSAELWLDYRAAIAAQLSVRRAADRCGISVATALRWRPRIGPSPDAETDGNVGWVETEKRALREGSGPPPDTATHRPVDFLEWARTATEGKNGQLMRARLEGLFGPAAPNTPPEEQPDRNQE